MSSHNVVLYVCTQQPQGDVTVSFSEALFGMQRATGLRRTTCAPSAAATPLAFLRPPTRRYAQQMHVRIPHGVMF